MFSEKTSNTDKSEQALPVIDFYQYNIPPDSILSELIMQAGGSTKGTALQECAARDRYDLSDLDAVVAGEDRPTA